MRIPLVVALLLAAPALAQEEASRAPDKAELTLRSGETLLGGVVQLKDGKLEFKSEQLGTQKIELDDVAKLRSAGSHTVVLEKGKTLKGRLEIDGDKVTVLPDGEAALELERGDLAVVNPDAEKTELDRWKFNATLGVTLTFGNSRSKNAGALALISREDDWTKLSLGYTAAYGEDQDGDSAKSHRGDGQLDLKITDMFYLTPFVGHAVYDKFQNINFRYRAGAGAGYYLFKSDALTWNIEAAFSYGETELRRVAAGAQQNFYDTSLRVATGFQWAISDSLKFTLTWETYVGTKKVKSTIHHGVANLSVKVYKGLALSIAAIFDRVENPGRDANLSLPRQNDLKVIAGLSVSI